MAPLAAAIPFLVANAATISAVATVAGAAVTAAGTIAASRSQAEAAEAAALGEQQAADFEANQLTAAGQREALQLRRNKQLALSTLQTRGAASGFAPDPTLAGDIEEFGTFQEQLALHGGISQAEARRFSGRTASGAASRRAGAIRAGIVPGAVGTILGGVGTAGARFAKLRTPRARTQ